MDFVDLQRRKRDRAKARRKPETSGPNVVRDPLFLLGSGFVLGSVVSYFYSNALYTPGISGLILLAAVISLARYFGWLLLGKRPGRTGPKTGSEKQLLLAILNRESGITPVEAALKTSLTVDEG